MNENLANEIRKTIESIKDMKTQASGINNYLSILEGLLRTDIQKKVEDAYKRGLEEGKKATFELVADASNAEYQRGLNDAWEAARKIIRMPEGNILDLFPDCYASVCTAVQAILKYDTSEAIAKLKAYEEKQKADDKIEVGDEVTHKSSPEKCGIVTKELENVYYIMWADGSCGVWNKENIVKTGRHFDIEKILEDMMND